MAPVLIHKCYQYVVYRVVFFFRSLILSVVSFENGALLRSTAGEEKMRASISISLLSLSLLLSHNKCVNFISDELFHHHHFARYAYKLHEFIAFPFVLVAFLLTVWCWMCVFARLFSPSRLFAPE